MPDTTPESDRILREAKRSLVTQRDGGTHRPAHKGMGGGQSIGKGSAELKLKSLLKRVRNIAIAVVAVWVGAGVASAIFGPLLFWGLMGAILATVVAVGVFGVFPKVKVPKRAELKLGNPKQMVARTELWLEAQRPALPPAAPQPGQVHLAADLEQHRLFVVQPAVAGNSLESGVAAAARSPQVAETVETRRFDRHDDFSRRNELADDLDRLFEDASGIAAKVQN